MSSWDYIVIGGGSAGAIVASRLSEDCNKTVLLLEAGTHKANEFSIKVPGAAFQLSNNPKYDWMYKSETETSLGKHSETIHAGKTLGGGSAINGMGYSRGHHLDYDEWAAEGNIGWDWENGILPFFKKMENADMGSDEHHGRDGPVGISMPKVVADFTPPFLEAALEIGQTRTDDINGSEFNGFGYLPTNIKDGVRQSSAICYLVPNKHRPNLAIVTGAVTEKVLFDGSKRAVGVNYQRKGKVFTAKANIEIVLSAGAIRSPQLLMLSGVGPRKELEKFGIPVLNALEGVGQNLQVHPSVYTVHELNTATFNREMNPLRQIRHGVEYLVNKGGLAATSVVQATGLVKLTENAERPDIGFLYIPAGFFYGPNDKPIIPTTRQMITLVIWVCRTKGRGSVTLASAAVEDYPVIDLGLLKSEEDIKFLVDGIKLSKKLFDAPAMKKLYREPVDPPSDSTSDEELNKFVIDNIKDQNHASCTCKMGQDEMSVVDERLRVRGVTGLRVADASIMPSITSSGTNPQAMMIGEKAAHMIMEDNS